MSRAREMILRTFPDRCRLPQRAGATSTYLAKSRRQWSESQDLDVHRCFKRTPKEWPHAPLAPMGMCRTVGRRTCRIWLTVTGEVGSGRSSAIEGCGGRASSREKAWEPGHGCVRDCKVLHGRQTQNSMAISQSCGGTWPAERWTAFRCRMRGGFVEVAVQGQLVNGQEKGRAEGGGATTKEGEEEEEEEEGCGPGLLSTSPWVRRLSPLPKRRDPCGVGKGPGLASTSPWVRM